jgi:hypothetical protein
MIEPPGRSFSLASAHLFQPEQDENDDGIPKGRIARKTLLQWKCWVRRPPRTGPRESPVYTAATLIPRTLPLSWGGKTEVRIASPVAKIIALPIPWRMRKRMSWKAEEATAQSKEERVKATIPKLKIFFLPYRSASLPNGTRHTAEDRR